MNELIKNYLESMIIRFCEGNDNEYKKGKLIKFKYEEIEKGDVDNYGEEEVNMFYEVRNYINEVKEVNYLFGDNKIEYKFIVKKKDIVCSFIEV